MTVMLAIGLVCRPRGTPTVDRHWARALVIRHARDAHLQLLDIVDLHHDTASRTLADLASTPLVMVLITDGVPPGLAAQLARDLGLRHEPVPPRRRPVSDP